MACAAEEAQSRASFVRATGVYQAGSWAAYGAELVAGLDDIAAKPGRTAPFAATDSSSAPLASRQGVLGRLESPSPFGRLGWPTGLEPATFGATIRCSAIELRPPRDQIGHLAAVVERH